MEFLEELGIFALAIVLIISLHVIAALLNTTTAVLLPGIVCYMWARMICRKQLEVNQHGY